MFYVYTIHDFLHSLKLISNESGKLTVVNSQGHKVIITADPLKFEFYNKNGDLAVVLNDNNQLIVEPLRVKREKIGDDDEAAAVEVRIFQRFPNSPPTHFESKLYFNNSIFSSTVKPL